ncbi:phage holin family protein [Kineococcus indalonis]|uniref:phage holin family protein n=1 Tax=Kineococcus indalonis TaxID=2696566 RepID=UPI001411DDBC|nr:phage holin family protein [Kineococcus indalonis]NAZ85917.1 phage holin family protein [Kineococcus indalonis]
MSGATSAPRPDTGGGGERSIGEIFSSITTELSTLVRQEIALAKTELRQDAKNAGRGAGLLTGAGVAGHLFLISLTALAILALGDLIGHAWAALIVTVVWGVIAAVLAKSGQKALKQVPPPLERTTTTLKEDVQWAKHPTT